MPKLWTQTIETHRKEVREAIVETTAALVSKLGLRAVTMSQIAEDTGIGRATLYKYFPDVESVLVAWHEEHVTAHLDQLASLSSEPGDAGARLEATLEAYALICYRVARQDHGAELTALVHRGEHLAGPQQHLIQLVQDLIDEGVRSTLVRCDIPTEELAVYSLNALAAAGHMASEAAVRRLVAVTIAGLRPTPVS